MERESLSEIMMKWSRFLDLDLDLVEYEVPCNPYCIGDGLDSHNIQNKEDILEFNVTFTYFFKDGEKFVDYDGIECAEQVIDICLQD